MNNPILIIGMHRSGTSCLTGTLEECGLVLGEVNKFTHCNQKGLRENTSFRELNEAVLAANGVDWKEPKAELYWSQAHRDERDALMEMFEDEPVWGFKDPRTLFTLDGWVERIPHVRLVGSFRNPLAVAQSLHARNGFEIEQGLAIWRRYNTRLRALHERYSFDLVNYDWPLDRYKSEVSRIARKLDLTPPDSLTFPEADLRHQQGTGQDIEADLVDLYTELNARAEVGRSVDQTSLAAP